ncbi:flagellar basal body-associated FliL family protein [Candidatus Paracaedibacter symbiosus]|uniref:flagellar basal body-associated FliL family protein n=1 Tax=Candidatus Paracaedibacter symbiosus TaxID=244582 RepID=UPI000509C105|nr:flagellar basal body-associated FliL family protein [Candidatus Paracaedibacter symbiosus]
MMQFLQLFLSITLLSCPHIVMADEEGEAAEVTSPANGEEAPPMPTRAMMAGPADASNFKTLEPMIIPIIKASKVYGYLRLEIQLATKDGTSIETLKPLFPILFDAYMTQLYSLICDRWLPDQPLNQDAILKIARELTAKITTEKAKTDNLTVYFKNFFFAPANK